MRGGTVATLPALLAAVFEQQPDAGGSEDLAAALRWVAMSIAEPLAGMANRLADQLAGGDDLASALRKLAAHGDEGARWAAAAVESQRDRSANLHALLLVADRVVAERAVITRERASLRAEARLVVVALLAQPLLLAGVGALMTAGVGALDLALLVVAVLLIVAGGWWLARVTRPPFDWRPWLRDRAEADPADDLLDRVALAGAAGRSLEEAVRWAAGDRPPDEVERMVEVLGARVVNSSGGGGADATPQPSVVGSVQDAATDLRRGQIARTRAATQRIRWLAAIPYVACILPASALIIVALLL